MTDGKLFFVYILYSLSLDKFYVGHTGDGPEERLRKHKSDHPGFTSRAKDWEVFYHETFMTKNEAYARERQIKSWKSHNRIKELINKKN